ncbi:hypothetical protein BDW71DRAFT_180953 [Aspergillus fruticulosus]
MGAKEVLFSKEIPIGQDDAKVLEAEELVTFMNWGSARVSTITTDPQTGNISTVHLTLDGASHPAKQKNSTWLAKKAPNLTPCMCLHLTTPSRRIKLRRTKMLVYT